MYGLRNDVDLEFLNGLKITDVKSTQFQIQVKLGNDVEISSESMVSLDGVRVCPEEAQLTLDSLAGKSICVVQRQGRGDLVLKFNEGNRALVFHDNEEHYESYTVTYPHGVIIV